MAPTASIRVNSQQDSIQYVARFEESPPRFDVYTWQFRLPDYAPQSLTIDRKTSGELTRYWSQKVFYENTEENLRPFHISAETGVVRQTGNGGYDIGRLLLDGEFVWREIQSKGMDDTSFSDVVGIQKFLDEGQRIVKAEQEERNNSN